MKDIKINAYGKINLSLDVLSKRKDGYHNISTIMQQIDLKDIIILRELKDGIIIESNHSQVPLDSTNLAYKAAKLIKERYEIDKGIRITIQKDIPIASGLAGGSTDAAAVIKGLNDIWNLNLSEKELMNIGVEIGADIPFCIMGGTAYAEGIGERLKKLPDFSNKLILLAHPDILVSTAKVYQSLQLDKIQNRPDMDKLIKNIAEDNVQCLSRNMVNVLEKVTLKRYEIIDELKKIMFENGALGSLMSGSGPTVFGIFDDEKLLHKCKRKLEKKVKNVYVTKTI